LPETQNVEKKEGMKNSTLEREGAGEVEKLQEKMVRGGEGGTMRDTSDTLVAELELKWDWHRSSAVGRLKGPERESPRKRGPIRYSLGSLCHLVERWWSQEVRVVQRGTQTTKRRFNNLVIHQIAGEGVVVEIRFGENEGLEQQSSRKNETQTARKAGRAEVPDVQSTQRNKEGGGGEREEILIH
jgi:hypothetical protein